MALAREGVPVARAGSTATPRRRLRLCAGAASASKTCPARTGCAVRAPATGSRCGRRSTERSRAATFEPTRRTLRRRVREQRAPRRCGGPPRDRPSRRRPASPPGTEDRERRRTDGRPAPRPRARRRAPPAWREDAFDPQADDPRTADGRGETRHARRTTPARRAPRATRRRSRARPRSPPRRRRSRRRSPDAALPRAALRAHRGLRARRGRAHDGPGAARSAGSPAGAAQSSIGTITMRALSRDRLVVCAADGAREVLRPGGLVDPDRVVAREPLQPACQERLLCEVATVLLPTRTTSGARFTRAVASAPTALPRPAVVWRIASAGSDRPIAQPVAIPTTDDSWRASTNSRSRAAQ